MKIKLRKLSKNDWPYFIKWWRDKELTDLTSGDHTPMADEEIKKQIREMTNDKSAHHWMICVDGKIVGHINLNKINDTKAELQIVIGEKDYWGKGLGKLAIEQVIEHAKTLGYKKIYVEARPENSRAIGLYGKCDFKSLGLKKYPENPNLPEVLIMEKRLE